MCLISYRFGGSNPVEKIIVLLSTVGRIKKGGFTPKVQVLRAPFRGEKLPEDG